MVESLGTYRGSSGRVSATLISALLVIGTLYFAREVLVPLALAGLLAFFLAPMANRLERWGIKKPAAAFIVIFLSIVGMGGFCWVVLEQIYSLAIELPLYQENIGTKIDSLHLNSAGKLSSTVEMLSSVAKQITSGREEVSPVVAVVPVHRTHVRSHDASSIASSKKTEPVSVKVEEPERPLLAVLGQTLSPLVHPMATALIVAIFLILMLLGRDDIRDRVLRLAGNRQMHVTTAAIEDASHRVSRYLQMQFLINLCYAAVAGVLLWFIGVPHPILWAVLTFLLRFVPYVGILVAAAGPILLCLAVSPGWVALIWTLVLFGILELVTANFAEPLLYSSSTGISAIAILVAAVFWTFLWGLPGLFLSTPLTVCLVVIGRQVPHLRFLDVLFGEAAVITPSEHFYRLMLASNLDDGRTLINELLKTQPRSGIYDEVVIPSLSQIEEARRSQLVSPSRAEDFIRCVEELVGEPNTQAAVSDGHAPRHAKSVLCVPARRLADEIACQLAVQVLADSASTRAILDESVTEGSFEGLDREVDCVVSVIGISSKALRHVRMKCRHIRSHYPNATVVACILGQESDLSTLRGRIPPEDAHHVVCSLRLLKEYLESLILVETKSTEEVLVNVRSEIEPDEHPTLISATGTEDILEGPDEGIFVRLIEHIAKSLDAPTALMAATDGQRHSWEAQCGLDEGALASGDLAKTLLVLSNMLLDESSLIIPDTALDARFENDNFTFGRGIRFCASAPLKNSEDQVIGFVCIFDTRPRNVTKDQTAVLEATVEAAQTAVALYSQDSENTEASREKIL